MIDYKRLETEEDLTLWQNISSENIGICESLIKDEKIKLAVINNDASEFEKLIDESYQKYETLRIMIKFINNSKRLEELDKNYESLKRILTKLSINKLDCKEYFLLLDMIYKANINYYCIKDKSSCSRNLYFLKIEKIIYLLSKIDNKLSNNAIDDICNNKYEFLRKYCIQKILDQSGLTMLESIINMAFDNFDLDLILSLATLTVKNDKIGYNNALYKARMISIYFVGKEQKLKYDLYLKKYKKESNILFDESMQNLIATHDFDRKSLSFIMTAKTMKKCFKENNIYDFSLLSLQYFKVLENELKEKYIFKAKDGLDEKKVIKMLEDNGIKINNFNTLTLGNIRKIFKVILKERDMCIKKRKSELKLDRYLFNLVDLFRNVENIEVIYKLIDDEVINTFRNPPAHTGICSEEYAETCEIVIMHLFFALTLKNKETTIRLDTLLEPFVKLNIIK